MVRRGRYTFDAGGASGRAVGDRAAGACTVQRPAGLDLELVGIRQAEIGKDVVRAAKHLDLGDGSACQGGAAGGVFRRSYRIYNNSVRILVIGYTPRGSVRHIFSMRKANDREQTRLAPYFGL